MDDHEWIEDAKTLSGGPLGDVQICDDVTKHLFVPGVNKRSGVMTSAGSLITSMDPCHQGGAVGLVTLCGVDCLKKGVSW